VIQQVGPTALMELIAGHSQIRSSLEDPAPIFFIT
jgi:hypothetical protein